MDLFSKITPYRRYDIQEEVRAALRLSTSLEAAAQSLPVSRTYEPDAQRHAFYQVEHTAFQELYRRLEQPGSRE